MTKIPLSQGHFAVVDDADAARVLKHKWTYFYNLRNKKEYARYGISRNRRAGQKQQTVWLHRFLMDAPSGVQVDHINGDGLDCQRGNMRLATNRENHRNMKKSTRNTSGYKGVSWDRRKHRDRKQWVAKIRDEHHGIQIGRFECPIEAARAYDAKAREVFGEFAWLNFPEEATCQA